MFNYPLANEKRCPNCGSEDLHDFVPLGSYSYVQKEPIDLTKEMPVLRYIYKCRRCGNRFVADWELPKGTIGDHFIRS